MTGLGDQPRCREQSKDHLLLLFLGQLIILQRCTNYVENALTLRNTKVKFEMVITLPLRVLCVGGGCVCMLFVILWTVARQAPLSMGFSRHEDWSGLPSPPPGDLPSTGIEPAFLAL